MSKSRHNIIQQKQQQKQGQAQYQQRCQHLPLVSKTAVDNAGKQTDIILHTGKVIYYVATNLSSESFS